VCCLFCKKLELLHVFKTFITNGNNYFIVGLCYYFLFFVYRKYPVKMVFHEIYVKYASA